MRGRNTASSSSSSSSSVSLSMSSSARNTDRLEYDETVSAKLLSDAANAVTLPPPPTTTTRERLETISMDEAIEKLGMGSFQNGLLLVAGLCFASDAIEVTLLSFLSTTLERQWSLESWQSSTITSGVFVGAIVGTLAFGQLGDYWGRRPAFCLGALLIGIFGFASAAATGFYTLLATRIIVGFGVGSVIVPFDLVAEFLPMDRRGRLLMRIEYFWTFGSMFVPWIASLTLENSWRFFVVLCAIPCMASALVGMYVIPESPRWFLVKGRPQEAMQVLKRAAIWNGKPKDLFANVQLEEEEEVESSNMMNLLKPQWRRLMVLIWSVWSGFGVCYFSTILVITRIFESSKDCPNGDDGDCGNDDSTGGGLTFDYGAIFVSASAEILGTFLVINAIDRIGRVPSQVVSYVLGGMALFILCWMADDDAASPPNTSSIRGRSMVALAFVARVFEITGSGVAWAITVELLPTEIRTTGHSTANALARLGNALSPYLVSTQASLQSIGGWLLVAHLLTAFCAFRLPETKGRTMGKQSRAQAEYSMVPRSSFTAGKSSLALET